MNRRATEIQQGVRHLKRVDPVMRRLIRAHPPLTELRLQRDRFAALANSILSQQISVHAARAVRTRLHERTGETGMTPEAIRALETEDLRTVGLSRQKAGYLKDLAEKVTSGEVRLDRLGRLADSNVIAELTKIRGVGVWTAQMFLIFALGRLDVFPADDYGVRSALQRHYGLDGLPDRATAERIAEPWRPYATVASWYCWRSLE